GVPDVDNLALFHLLPVGAVKHATGRHGEAVELFAISADNTDFAAAVYHHFLALTVRGGADVVKLHAAVVHHLDFGAFHLPACGTADVEGAHGKLGARLADGLGRDNTHGF